MNAQSHTFRLRAIQNEQRAASDPIIRAGKCWPLNGTPSQAQSLSLRVKTIKSILRNSWETQTFGKQMPYPENALIRRGRQIVTEPPKIELDPMDLHDGSLARFIERLTHIVRNIRGKK
jgi:hypothetical protein